MRCFASILSIIAALTSYVAGSGYTQPAWLLVNRNQSSLFGYQLVGSRLFNTSDVCNNTNIASHGKWNGHVDPTSFNRRMPPIIYAQFLCG